MLISGMKKNATATPCTSVGSRMVHSSACVVKRERIHSTSANTRKAKVVSRRGSTLPSMRPTKGESTMASSPTGASAMPAAVAV